MVLLSQVTQNLLDIEHVTYYLDFCNELFCKFDAVPIRIYHAPYVSDNLINSID